MEYTSRRQLPDWLLVKVALVLIGLTQISFVKNWFLSVYEKIKRLLAGQGGGKGGGFIPPAPTPFYSRARIFKRLWIDSKKLIPPAYVA
jgi:hypothetical protein